LLERVPLPFVKVVQKKCSAVLPVKWVGKSLMKSVVTYSLTGMQN